MSRAKRYQCSTKSRTVKLHPYSFSLHLFFSHFHFSPHTFSRFTHTFSRTSFSLRIRKQKFHYCKMSKGPGLFSDIGKKAKDLLTKDYLSDHKFSVSTYSESGVVQIFYIIYFP
ncbi:hypothetical protein MIMGU_mgv1a016650mg [Erythranthe guttata]|uniref:Uncharacterized protein n=1 Tax=Erythranthe guttata TaxID=4155 RepID=A0A022RXS5_ERYGU|nr:hypothetical protein MIMGU_mgv1a016650mg [Erythranthe guttata]